MTTSTPRAEVQDASGQQGPRWFVLPRALQRVHRRAATECYAEHRTAEAEANHARYAQGAVGLFEGSTWPILPADKLKHSGDHVAEALPPKDATDANVIVERNGAALLGISQASGVR
jgi:hypothetical protein